MRCRKVRSCLSAFCKDELAGRRLWAIQEHLDECPDCRRDEAVHKEIDGLVSGLPNHNVTDDFNSRLLEKVVQERMKETRSKAYLPKNAPIFGWGKIVPAMASACLVLAFVFFGGLNVDNNVEKKPVLAHNNTVDVYNPDELDTRYIDIQPQKNPPPVIKQHEMVNWTFKKQLARATRIRNIMNQLTSSEYFGNGYSRSKNNRIIPASQSIVRQQPVYYYPVGRNGQPVQIDNTAEVR